MLGNVVLAPALVVDLLFLPPLHRCHYEHGFAKQWTIIRFKVGDVTGSSDACSLGGYHGSLEGNNTKWSVIVANAELVVLVLFQQHGLAHLEGGFLHTAGVISIFVHFGLALLIQDGCFSVLFRGEVV